MDNTSHVPIDYEWSRRFDEMENSLRAAYPDLADAINRHLWYSDLVIGDELADFLKKTLICNKDFWDPGPDVAKLIRNNIAKHFANWRFDKKTHPLRLREKTALQKRQPDDVFSKLPVGYDECLRAYLNDITIRISEITAAEFRVSKACYLDQLGTNILCDEPVDGGRSFREIDRGNGKRPPPFVRSALANTIGVSCIFIDCDGNPILRYRRQEKSGERMAIMEEGWHCTSSGVLKFDDVFDLREPSGRIADVSKGLLRESNYETGIWDHENLYHCEITGFARELKRAGKPQFFHAIRFHTLRAPEIMELIRARVKIEGDEYAGKIDRLGLVGKFFDKLKVGRVDEKIDLLVDDRLNLQRLTRADLAGMAERKERKMTFECFANLYTLCRN